MNITLFGGSGFVGHALTAQLVNAGHRVTIPTRNREHVKVAAMQPTVTVIYTPSFDDATLTQLISGADAVVNLIGILHERKAGDFLRVHRDLTQRIVNTCSAVSVKRYIHMSALGAATDGPSNYLQSRGESEAVVCASKLNWTMFAPSVIFGQGDSFLTMFSKIMPLMPPLMPMMTPRTSARFQPVWVQDVARAVAAALTDASTVGQRYELGGPKVFTLGEILVHVRERLGRSAWQTPVFSTPPPFGFLQAMALEFVPGGPLMSRDNLRSMSVDNVTTQAWPAFIQHAPSAMEAITPSYIGDVPDAYARYRKT
jgi:uncharacterized protein YbjT (DUF2867 family)